MKTVHVLEEAVRLTVDETDRVLEALQNAKVLRSLDGRQRQYLEDAIAILTEAGTKAANGWVYLKPQMAAEVLKCVAFTQKWLGDMFENFAGIE